MAVVILLTTVMGPSLAASKKSGGNNAPKGGTANVGSTYAPDFTYESEFVSKALMSATVKVFNVYNVEFKFRQIKVDLPAIRDLMDKAMEEDPDLDKTSAFRMAFEEYYEYLYYDEDYDTRTRIMGGTGSGVVLSEDGYIATNYHVVADLSNDDLADLYDGGLQAFAIEDAEDVCSKIEKEFGCTLSADDKDFIAYAIYNAYSEDASIKKGNHELYIMYPGPEGEATQDDEKRKLEAEVVDDGGEIGTVNDIAILKVDAEDLVALSLTDEYPASGVDIWAMGYPGAADISEESVLTATLSDGTISGVKEMPGSKYKSIQMTADIGHGNSGGPSVNNKLKVLGLNTFATGDEISSFKFMVPWEIIQDKLDDLDAEPPAEQSQTFLAGIQALQKKDGSTALACFEEVKDNNPDIPYIENLIEEAEKIGGTKSSAKNKGNSKPNAGAMDTTTIIIIVVAAVAVILIIVIVVVASSKKKKAASMAVSSSNWSMSMDGGVDLGGSSNNNNDNYPPTPPATGGGSGDILF